VFFSGAGIGFIIASIPGMILGGYVGNRLGAIRDTMGKSVTEVFPEFADKKAGIFLKALAFKVLGTDTKAGILKALVFKILGTKWSR